MTLSLKYLVVAILGFLTCLKAIDSNAEAEYFISKLLKNDYLSQCGLMIIRDGLGNYEESFTFLTRNSEEQFYNIKYSYQNSTLNITNPLDFPVRISNTRKISSSCMIVLLYIADFSPEFILQIRSLISPLYHPIIQKDTDKFIFLTESRLMDKLLLMEEYPAKVKFKIAVSIQKYSPHSGRRSSGSLVVKTVCFFCNAGNPRILQFPSKFTEEFEYFPDFVENLNGKTIKVSTPGHVLRFETKGPPYEGINNGKRGLWKNLLEDYLGKKLNFTYNAFVSTGADGKKGDGGTGLIIANGTWIGTTGDVVSGRADIAIVTANTINRAKVVDFTDSFLDLGSLCFITPRAREIFSPLALLWPFDILMWSLIGASTLIAFVVFWILSLIMKNSEGTGYLSLYPDVYLDKWSFQKQFLFILTSYLDQDSDNIPPFQPIRCFVSCWFIFTMIITTVYRSKMVALLAFPETEKLPTSYEELAYSDLKVGFVKHGDSAYNTLKASTDPTYIKLVNEMEIITGSGLPCLERSIQDHYACIAYDFAVTYLIAKNFTEAETRSVVLSPARTYLIWLGLTLESRSIYKTSMDKWLRWTRPCHLHALWEARDMYYDVSKVKKEWWKATNQTDKLEHKDEEGGSNLHFKNISGAFYLIFLGLLISAITFGIENAYYRLKPKSS